MKSIDSHIELLKEQFESVGINLNSITWGRLKLSHERFAQQSNKELVEMLEEFTNAVETEEIIIKENYDNDGWENCGNRLYEKAKLLINKNK